MKLTIVGRDEWKTEDRKTGEEISGLSFIAYTPNDKVIKFTTRGTDHVAHLGQVGFDPQLSEEVNIRTKEFGGKISYQEIESDQ